MQFSLLSFCVALVSYAEIVVGDVGLTVDLGYSKYEGRALGNGVSQWLGIRYAAPPLGELRFRAPAPPLFNSTLQIANKHGPLCQPTPEVNVTGSEDCLFLDVQSPTNNDAPHPVYVFFQGGGFNSLSNPNLNASSLINASDYDIVVVTFNYRVGLFGFLASEEIQKNGDTNVGLKDQRAVLWWVQKYIHLFGGDPGHVTIGGDSAGAASVNLHMTAFGGRDDGLFHAAAAESQSFGPQFTVAESQYQYDAIVNRVGCNSSYDTLACLRSLSLATLAKNNIVIPTPGGGGGNPEYMYSNVIDGDFTTDYTYNLFSHGKFVKVPSIFGDDTNEGTIFVSQNISTLGDMITYLRDNFPKLTEEQLWVITDFYPRGAQYPNAGAYWSATAKAYGEMRYNCPGIFISGAISHFSSLGSWNYHWDVLSAANAASGYGVTHTAEVASIWGHSSPPDSALIPTIQAYWTSFIRTGDPNRYKLREAPEWEQFSVEKRRLHFVNQVGDVAMENVPDGQGERCIFLSWIGPSIQQ